MALSPERLNELLTQIDRDGYAVLPGVFAAAAIEPILAELTFVLRSQSDEEGSIRSSRDRVYAARNLLQVWPRAFDLACEPPLRDVLTGVLGPGCGLVRALFFDKPPGRSWALPWHKDMTIAVRDNTARSRHFSKPTTKAGVPHVAAPESLLESMLTARIHLDDVTEENGPLLVVPGSHRSDESLSRDPRGAPSMRAMLCSAGDVLLMRPLVSHSSGNSHEGTARHRRIVHLELASAAPLPDGYEWFDFRAIR